jgi:hypothetical protein
VNAFTGPVELHAVVPATDPRLGRIAQRQWRPAVAAAILKGADFIAPVPEQDNRLVKEGSRQGLFGYLLLCRSYIPSISDEHERTPNSQLNDFNFIEMF